MPFSFRASDNGFIHLCGHRGHSLGAPENTLAAFRACHALGGTICEIDTVLTRDKQIIVLHDLTVDRTTDGTGAAKDLTLAEIRALDAGAKFGAEYAGTRISTLAEVLAATRGIGMGFDIEVKEELDLPGYTAALRDALADSADMERVMMISFDHASLKDMKAAIPGLRTAGIVHERYADPVVVARVSDLDELDIDLSVYHPEDARRLHEAGITIRCHAYSPAVFEQAERAGLPWRNRLVESLQNRLIDTFSGDDVGWLRAFRDAALAG